MPLLIDLYQKYRDRGLEILAISVDEEAARYKVGRFVKEHELTHRSQLFMYLRLKGVVPATTRRRLAMQAKK